MSPGARAAACAALLAGGGLWTLCSGLEPVGILLFLAACSALGGVLDRIDQRACFVKARAPRRDGVSQRPR